MPAPLLKVNAAGINAYAGRLKLLGDEAPNAILRALNRAGEAVDTRMVRWLNTATGVPSTRIKKSIKMIPASQMAPATRIKLYSGGRTPLIQFSPAIQQSHLPKGAFKARMRSGHVGYFKRRIGSRHRRKGEPFAPHELPLDQIYGPPWSEFLGDVGVADLLKYGSDRLKIELEHELEYRESRRIFVLRSA